MIINEYHNGRFHESWDNLDECAKAHNTHSFMIKALIYNGTPLPYSAHPLITFDIDEESDMEIVFIPNASKRKQYRIVPKDHD